nr:hypothetical protein [Haemoproteus columbae]
MTILYKYKILITNPKLNLLPILNLKFKIFNINIILLNKMIIEYITKYNINIFIVYIYSNKLFKLIYNYTTYFLYKKYIKNLNKIFILYKILLYKKIQLLFYNIKQLLNIIYYNIN